jgi:hypothetical protein
MLRILLGLYYLIVFNYINQAFANLHEAQEAIEKLNTMKQGSRSFQDFIGEFEETMLKAGSYTLPNETRKRYLKTTLNKTLTKKLIGKDKPDQYNSPVIYLRKTSYQLDDFNRRYTR